MRSGARTAAHVWTRHVRRWLLLCLAFVGSAGVPFVADAAEVTLAWTASSGSGVVGYYVYYGTSSRSYPSRLNVGNATSFTVQNLAAGQRYYFAVSAYSSQQESAYSGEVAATAAAAIAATTTTVTSAANPSVLGTSVTLTATVTGTLPTGAVTFSDGGGTIPGCGSVVLGGSGNVRTATCRTSLLSVGTRVIVASFGGSASAAASSGVYRQYVHATSAASTFADVPADHWAFAAVEALAHHRISLGCASGPRIFCADEVVNRDEIAVFLERAMRGIGFVYAPTGTRFADVPPTHWAAGPIEQLFLDGVTGGCAVSPLRFCPDNVVTRDQMAILLLRGRYGAGYNPPGAAGGVFADVDANHWAAAWIEEIYRRGITSGCTTSPRNFCPDQPVSRLAMAVFLQRIFNLAAP